MIKRNFAMLTTQCRSNTAMHDCMPVLALRQHLRQLQLIIDNTSLNQACNYWLLRKRSPPPFPHAQLRANRSAAFSQRVPCSQCGTLY